uniref:hypothetical protein n=1 Tax=Pengzhenrongella sicca TaxID=2819238 RepID=UPI001D0CB6DB|nr:hypothetical protein [Pengzhenrongella sicca]
MSGFWGSLPQADTIPLEAPSLLELLLSVSLGLSLQAVSTRAPTATDAAKPAMRLIFNVPPEWNGGTVTVTNPGPDRPAFAHAPPWDEA